MCTAWQTTVITATQLSFERNRRNQPEGIAQFIGKEMRLSKVEYAPRAESGPIFNLDLDKHTPEWKAYIMGKLVEPVEE